ncbi:SDR family NAD(P)-dependent oxidoreductase [Streptomyces violaceoruber]|uniref:Glucose 1-dehydrogenase n=4 Tax=Streptomyces TaxID=1883 RepID=Q9AK65_STRCO|nr:MULTISPECIES: SDR family NAD(P)-dependent oxidoreductase [Streptomyces]QSJ10124.1 glucose 1-dehydrogenase [Streptomyces lividans]WOY99296.1 SDR family NAD(P)-dependent oxidoreductase [Streptomyces violaceoruber]AIJ14587.1 glucose 1-dehydrogenase [Streptomyces lividans TK24]EFD67991.1 glucose 1-dehydrogenase [Streptomyces lividans TK24]KKD10200.1 short-chain dehydrogenase [Streptomyces sp. WM6391]
MTPAPRSAASTHLLDGRIALVTGAGGGIGRGIALRFAEEGAAVAVHCRTTVESAREVAERIRGRGGRATVLRADLTDEDACRRLVGEAAEWGGGRLDALVNNAGVQPLRELPGMTATEWRAVVDTNLTGVFACTQAAAAVMRAQDGGGTVTHIASIEARAPAPAHAHYSASKAAVVMHARSAALEYGPWGVRVNSVSPGLVDREGLAEAWPEGVRRWRRAAPTGRLGRPEDVGDACVFLASRLASWVTGHDLVVDGGVTARPSW